MSAPKIPTEPRVVQLHKVTRLEVIDSNGRVFVEHYAPAGIEVHLQDDGRTAKVFAGTPTPVEQVARTAAEIRGGQQWRRRSDGVLVVVESAGFVPEVGYSIVRWRRVEGRNRGDIDFGSFAHRYELVEVSA